MEDVVLQPRAPLEVPRSRRDLVALLSCLAATIAIVAGLALRSPPPRIAPPAVAVESSAAESPMPGAMVHVAGAVRSPGLYGVPPGARVADALDLAGGPTRRADLSALNLAEPVTDGQKIDVPRKGAVAPVAAPPVTSPSTATAPATVVDINDADATLLETLPGVGPVTAAAIVAHRDEAGAFETVEELLEVDGIGPATLEEMRPFVRL